MSATEAAAEPSRAPVTDKLANPLSLSADFRYRFEEDWDSRTDDGSDRKNRFRMRYRLRVGFGYRLNEYLSFGGRLRTGVPTNIQSPHLNVGYNGLASGPFNLDKAFAKVEVAQLWAWAGKNSFPLWKQNELFWDDDVTPEGIAAGAKLKRGYLEFRPTVAFLVADHDQVVSYADGRILASQLAVTAKPTETVSFDVALAYLHMQRIFTVQQPLGGTDQIDYQFVVGNARATIDIGRPLVLGLDYFVNVADYEDVDAVAEHYKDQKHGVVAHIHYGSVKRKSDFLVGYYFAYKQRYSVVDYYSEDDWVRWGNIDGNRNTNYQGHEVRLAYAFDKKINVVARFYSVEALKARIENDPMAVKETGKRVRLDFNMGF